MIRSIQGRLNLAFIGLTLITFAVLWLLQGMTLRNTAYENVGDRMKSDALTVLRALEPYEGGMLRVNPQVISAVYQQPMSGHYFQYQVDGDIWRFSRSLWDEEIPTYDGRPIGDGGLTLQRKNNKPWLVYDTEFTKAGHKVRIVLAEDVEPYRCGDQTIKPLGGCDWCALYCCAADCANCDYPHRIAQP